VAKKREIPIVGVVDTVVGEIIKMKGIGIAFLMIQCYMNIFFFHD